MFVFYSSISQYALEGCTRRLQPTIISVVYECGIVSQWWTAAGKWPSHPRVVGLGDLPLTCGCQAEPVRGIFRSELSSDWDCSLQGLASPSPCSLGLQHLGSVWFAMPTLATFSGVMFVRLARANAPGFGDLCGLPPQALRGEDFRFSLGATFSGFGHDCGLLFCVSRADVSGFWVYLFCHPELWQRYRT